MDPLHLYVVCAIHAPSSRLESVLGQVLSPIVLGGRVTLGQMSWGTYSGRTSLAPGGTLLSGMLVEIGRA